MSNLKIIDRNGKAVGDVELPDELLVGEGKGSQAVRDAVIAYRNGLRAGTASSLGKGEVAGSNRKPWRQKGTGRARAGYRQSPVWRGGGAAFGPKPRDYGQSLPRKVQRLAFRRAFSDKVAEGGVRIVDDLALPAPKTREFMALIKGLGVQAPALFVADRIDRTLLMAMRNVPGVELTTAACVHTYQLVRYPVVVVTRAGFEALKARLTAGRAS